MAEKVVIKYRGGETDTFENVSDYGVSEPGAYLLFNENKEQIAFMPLVNILSVNFVERDRKVVLAQPKVSLT